jgi:hypothetical protein
MQKTTRRLAGGLLASGLLAAAPTPGQAADDVTVRVEGRGGHILGPVEVTTSPRRPVGLPGRPSCAGDSALAALDAATGGVWDADYFSGLGYSVDSVLGRHVPSQSYFGFWFNRKYASAGLCDTKPRSGDEILLFTTPFSEPPGGLLPLGVRTPAAVTAGRRFRVRVVQYAQSGAATPVAGATVRFKRVGGGGRAPLTTDANGYVALRAGRGRDLQVRAVKTDRVRSELDRIDVR